MSVIDHVGCTKPIVMGHSMGGAIASSLAVERPDVPRAIVVLDPPYAADPESAARAQGLTPALQTEAAAEAVKALWQKIHYTDETPAWLRVLVERRLDALSQETLHGGFVGMWDHDIACQPAADAYLSRRDCPVLAIHARRDLSDYEQDTFRDLRSRALHWPGAGHWIQAERPTELATVLVEWVSDLGPTEAGTVQRCRTDRRWMTRQRGPFREFE